MVSVVSSNDWQEVREQAMCKLSFLSSMFSQAGDIVLNDQDKIGLVVILDDIRQVYEPGEAA